MRRGERGIFTTSNSVRVVKLFSLFTLSFILRWRIDKHLHLLPNESKRRGDKGTCRGLGTLLNKESKK